MNLDFLETLWGYNLKDALFALHQKEKLKRMELQHKIAKRWSMSEPKFLAAIEKAEATKREKLLEELYHMAVERHLQLMLKERYSQGQKQAIRLAKLANKQTNKIKNKINRYNAELSVLQNHIRTGLKQICFDDVKDPRSPFFADFTNGALSSEESVPFSTKKRLIDLYELRDRCTEEEELLQKECSQLFMSKLSAMNKLEEKAFRLSQEKDAVSLGLSAMYKFHCAQITQELFANKSNFEHFGHVFPDYINEFECEFTDRVFQKYKSFSECEDMHEYRSCTSESESDSDNDALDDLIDL